MKPDNILMIPYLSKELNLIGFPTLPFRLENKETTKSTSKGTLEITFNSKQMIEALISTCFELVKRVKTLGEDDYSALDKIIFENLKLEKQLKLSKSETKKTITDLDNAKKENQLLQEKVHELQKKLKNCEVNQHQLAKKNETDKDLLKHALKKKESEVFELHKLIWKQFNLADQNYFPKNFELIQINQPDISKLWSIAKYSNLVTKEESLKEAICILHKNYKSMMEDNFTLKTSFLTILQEINEILNLMVHKLHFPSSLIISFEFKDIFQATERFNATAYINILQKHFEHFQKFCELFDEASFTVCDELFVCWTKIIKSL